MQKQPRTIEQIKEDAREKAGRLSRNAAAITLIRSAKQQSQRADQARAGHDLEEALSALMMAGVLTRAFMNTEEFKREGQAKGVLYKEFQEFSTVR